MLLNYKNNVFMKYLIPLLITLLILILIAKNNDKLFFIVNLFIPEEKGGEWNYSDTLQEEIYTAPLVKKGFININVKIKDKEYLFLLDTGSTASAIKSNIAREVGIKSKRITLPYFYGNNIFRLIFLPLVQLKENVVIGSFIGKDIEWNIIDEGQSEIYKRYDGIIGLNIIKNFIINLDYSENKVNIFLKNKNIKDRQYEEMLPVSRSSKIDIMYNGKKRKALIDTGSNAFVDIYEIIKPVWFNKKQKHGLETHLFNGKTKQSYYISNANIEIGNYIISCTIFNNYSLNYLFNYNDVVFGLEFLSNFNWTFDFKNGKVYFEACIPSAS